jgi:hypothetical protein
MARPISDHPVLLVLAIFMQVAILLACAAQALLLAWLFVKWLVS